ncbi:hypothetical protein LX73_2218 [Fodinibius salinus]|uniref:Uncharacterized protein n=1 Tax=Fodinibius salinus TaxID=860790 RepID=A0A5D3YFI3_9BACT|nr:hypothetical protein LX73_2218 [Fodinibius salinus]
MLKKLIYNPIIQFSLFTLLLIVFVAAIYA